MPLTLFCKENRVEEFPNDTIEWTTFDSNSNIDTILINNQIKYDQFYDSLVTKASKNKITKTALDLLLVNQPAYGKFIGIENIRNEEYYKYYSGKKIRKIEIIELDVFGPTLRDTSKTTTRWLQEAGTSHLRRLLWPHQMISNT